MTIENASMISERDQLWASLRNLRNELERLAAGGFDDPYHDQAVAQLMARIIMAELDYRLNDMESAS